MTFSSLLSERTESSPEVRDSRGVVGILIFVFILAAATGFVFFREFHDFYDPDTPSYIVSAANMLAGRGFMDEQGNPETLRTPGYPLLILPFLWAHLNLRNLILLQHILRILMIVLTSLFALRVTESRAIALLTGTLLCLDLPLLESANTLITETLFMVVLLGIFWLLWKEPKQQKPGIHCLTAGLLAGASVLIRPVNILFFVPAAAYLWLARNRFKFRAALIFSLTFLCLPLAWGIRNYYRTGIFTVASISGIDMLWYRAAGALAIDDPGDFNQNFQKRRTEVQVQACEDIEKLYKMECSQVPPAQRAAYSLRLGRSIVLAHPLGYAKLFVRGEIQMMFNGNMIKVRKLTGLGPRLARFLLVSYTVPVFCLAILGLATLWNANRQLFLLILLICPYFPLISSSAGAYSRHRVPIDPLYILAAAIGLYTSLKRLAAKNEITDFQAAGPASVC